MKVISKYRFFSFLLCYLSVIAGYGQYSNHVRFNHLTVDDGLSNSSVHCIYQDQEGFIWIGTNGGVDRFDGYSSRHFPIRQGNEQHQVQYPVKAVFDDQEGHIWFGTNQLARYNKTTGKVKWYNQAINPSNDLVPGLVSCIYKDNSGRIWYGTEGNGLYRYVEKVDSFIHYRSDANDPYSLSNDNVSTILQDRFGVLWIGTGNGLNRFDVKNDRFLTWFHDRENNNSLSSNRVSAIFEDRSGDLWIGTNPGGLNLFDRKSEGFIHFFHDENNPYSLSNDRIEDISQDKYGNLLVATNYGYNVFNIKNKTFSRYYKNDFDYYSINSNFITSIFVDRSGVVWLGTYTAGINKYEPREKLFKSFKNIPGQPNSLGNNNVSAITKDDKGNLWIGTKGGGLNRFDTKTNRFDHYYHEPGNEKSLNFNTVLSLCFTGNSGLWIGNTGLEKLVYHEKNQAIFEQYAGPGNNSLIEGSVVWDIEGDENTLWIGSLNYLNRVELENGVPVSSWAFMHSPGDTNSLSQGHVKDILVLDDEIWIAANHLNRATISGPGPVSFQKISIDTLIPGTLEPNIIVCLARAGSKRLWIGTRGYGLVRYDPASGQGENFTTKEGLCNNIVWGIVEDKNGHAWISTNNGLSRFDPVSEEFKNFDVKDGLPGNVFNERAYHVDAMGNIYFGGTNGFVMFHPDSIKDDPFQPNVVITDLKILNKPIQDLDPGRANRILDATVPLARKVHLSHKDYVFSFEFSSLDYSNPGKILYKYKMEPFESSWNHTNSKARVATYTNLPPGDYKFMLMATNSDKVWVETPLIVDVIVDPPFWKTWWAYVIYFLLLTGILLLLRNFIVFKERYKHELRIERMEAQKNKEINQLKLKFFTNISHEFRTPLTLIIGPLENLIHSNRLDEKTKKQFESIHRNAERLLKLVNQVLDFRKIESGNLKLNLCKSNIIQHIKELCNSFDSVAELNNIHFTVSTKLDYQEAYFDMDKLEKIIYNLLSNAFKYTPSKGLVELIVEKILDSGKEFLEIRVVDSGIGIEKSLHEKIFDRFYNTKSKSNNQEGTGIGLELTRELVHLHHGSIKVESEPGKGSCFIVKLPLGQDHFSENDLQGIVEMDDGKYSQTPGETVPGQLEEASQDQKSLILVVEDNKEVRDFIIDNLDGDYGVLEASNGQEGLELASARVPDIILSDIMMPVMDGLEFCEKIKSNINTSHIPLIMLTAKVSDQHKLEGLETGADDYITKPFNTRQLNLKIRNILESRKRLREKFKHQENIDIKSVATNTPDEKFLRKATEIVEKNLSDPEFDNKAFLVEIGMSRTQLYRKLKALTNQSVHEFIRNIRLNKAIQLLHQQELTISEITYEVGFNNHSYFNKCFKDQFGISPSEYLKSKQI